MTLPLLIFIPVLIIPFFVTSRFGKRGFFACFTSIFCGFALVDGIVGDSFPIVVLGICVVIPGYFAAYIGDTYR